MRKFKTNELLNRDEMKSVQGSGYGCSTSDCTFYDPFVGAIHNSSCNFNFIKNKCECYDHRNYPQDC